MADIVADPISLLGDFPVGEIQQRSFLCHHDVGRHVHSSVVRDFLTLSIGVLL